MCWALCRVHNHPEMGTVIIIRISWMRKQLSSGRLKIQIPEPTLIQ